MQLTERFLDSKDYIPSKWPSQYVDDFLPILELFKYQQGSLMQSSVESSGTMGACTPLVPVHECIWKPSELQQLKGLVRTVFHLPNSPCCNVIMVTRRSKGVLIDRYVLSSATPRYSKSNLIFANRQSSGTSSLAQIMYFSECQCEISNSAQSRSENSGSLQSSGTWITRAKCGMGTLPKYGHLCNVQT